MLAGSVKLPELAAHAIQDVSHQTNPRRCTQNDMRHLYEQIYDRL